MAKNIALHDFIQIDEVDYSNSFRTFGLSSESEQVDVSGFSSTGADEFLAGKTTRSFTGECFYDETIAVDLWDLHNNKTVFEVIWKPEGLLSSGVTTNLTYYGNCQLLTFNPDATRGDVRVMSCTFIAADSSGIQATTGT